MKSLLKRLGIFETLEIMGDPEQMDALRRGIEESRKGKGISWERAKRKLGL